jgi:hypothetical protein
MQPADAIPFQDLEKLLQEVDGLTELTQPSEPSRIPLDAQKLDQLLSEGSSVENALIKDLISRVEASREHASAR